MDKMNSAVMPYHASVGMEDTEPEEWFIVVYETSTLRDEVYSSSCWFACDETAHELNKAYRRGVEDVVRNIKGE